MLELVNIDEWMNLLIAKLKEAFGDKLLFVGIQGSYRRGEAQGDSDIDAVVVFDELSIDVLEIYRDIIDEMPESEKSCGFVGDRRALKAWPCHELFQFIMDTRPLYSTLDGMLPEISREDIIESVRIGAAGIYHACCHSFLHDGGYIDTLKELYKAAYFPLIALHYLRSGEYIQTKKELLPLLLGEEQEILAIGMNWGAEQEHICTSPETYTEKLIAWSSGILNTL